MIAVEYTIKCSIPPPSIIYTGRKDINNQFAIEFEKVPSGFKLLNLKKTSQKMPLSHQNNAKPQIYVRLSFGEGAKDLCTKKQASDMTFTTIDGDGWTMLWSDRYECFIVSPPNNFEFPDDYRVSFYSNNFYTSAKEGITTLVAYFNNFDDIKTEKVAVNLYKRDPVHIDLFESDLKEVEIGKKALLSWKVINCKKCYITGIGQVDPEGFKGVEINKPTDFELLAEDDMGITERAYIEVGCKKPTIKLWSASQFYHKGDSITLHWESTSTTLVQMIPSIGQLSTSGRKTIVAKENNYVAIARGYDGSKAYSELASLYLESTPWKKLGQVKGLDMTTDSLNFARRVWEYKGNYYLLNNKILYKSADLLTWEKISQLSGVAVQKYKECSTIVQNNKFHVMLEREHFDYEKKFAIYNFDTDDWTVQSDLYMLRCGPNTAVCALNEQQIYYCWFDHNGLKFCSDGTFKHIWNDSFIYECCKLDAYDLVSLQGDLYVAMLESENGLIKVISLEGSDTRHPYTSYSSSHQNWIDLGSINKKVDGWVRMISTKNRIYLLTKDWIINLNDFQRVSSFHPLLDETYCPWMGSRNHRPFLITKEGDLWCYEE